MNIKTDYQLKKLCELTMYDLEYVFVSAKYDAQDCVKIARSESILTKYHHERFLITGYHSAPGFKAKMIRESVVNRLKAENKRLRLQLSERI